jgi:hypothetical protein
VEEDLEEEEEDRDKVLVDLNLVPAPNVAIPLLMLVERHVPV